MKTIEQDNSPHIHYFVVPAYEDTFRFYAAKSRAHLLRSLGYPEDPWSPASYGELSLRTIQEVSESTACCAPYSPHFLREDRALNREGVYNLGSFRVDPRRFVN